MDSMCNFFEVARANASIMDTGHRDSSTTAKGVLACWTDSVSARWTRCDLETNYMVLQHNLSALVLKRDCTECPHHVGESSSHTSYIVLSRGSGIGCTSTSVFGKRIGIEGPSPASCAPSFLCIIPKTLTLTRDAQPFFRVCARVDSRIGGKVTSARRRGEST